MKSLTIVRVLCAGLVAAFFVVLPGTVSAAYTMHGHTFETLAELTEYLDEYQRVYNELHGTAPTTARVSETTRTSTSAISSRARNAPTVTTASAQLVDMYSARLVGTVVTTNTKAVRVWFEYGTYRLTGRTADEVLYQDRSVRTFDSELRNLEHNTTYYYRAVAVNDSGAVAYGAIKSFKTAVDPRKDTAAVRIRTAGAKNTDDNHTTLNATIDFRKAAYARVWFEYGDEANDLYKKTPVQVVTPRAGKTYQRTITKLDEKTQYYFRAVAEDPSGARSYGKVTKLTTKKDIPNEKPKVTMGKVTDVTMYSAIVAGTVDMNDFRDGSVFLIYGEDKTAVTTIGKEYTRFKTIREDGDDLQKVLLDSDLDRLGAFTEQLLFLDLGTKYYATIGVEYENSEGDDVLLMGKTVSFTTKVK